jgi:hypothetical protein
MEKSNLYYNLIFSAIVTSPKKAYMTKHRFSLKGAGESTRHPMMKTTGKW